MACLAIGSNAIFALDGMRSIPTSERALHAFMMNAVMSIIEEEEKRLELERKKSTRKAKRQSKAIAAAMAPAKPSSAAPRRI